MSVAKMSARARGSEAPVTKKRKVTKSSNAPRRQPSKEQLCTRVALYERANSDQSQSRGTPVFRQPHSPQPLMRRRQAATEDQIQDEDMVDDEDLPPEPKSLNDKHQALGKIFALTIWPWPSPSWWISDPEEVEVPRNKRLSKKQQETKEAKQKLDAKKHLEFLNFIRLDNDVPYDVWTSKAFQSAVTVFYTRCTCLHSDNHFSSFWQGHERFDLTPCQS